jgi:hypothetical protein
MRKVVLRSSLLRSVLINFTDWRLNGKLNMMEVLNGVGPPPFMTKPYDARREVSLSMNT